MLSTNTSLPPFKEKKGSFVVDDSIGISLLTSCAFKENKESYLLVTSSLFKAQKIYDCLLTFNNHEDVLLFPADELVRAEALAQSKEMVASRIYALNEILTNSKNKIIVTNVAALTRFLPNSQLFLSKCLKLEVNEDYSFADIKKTLIQGGYSLVNKVDQSLQFAVRGDIIDVFSVNLDNPVRIEFFGDTIESIKYFDIATQASIKQIKKVTILPASDFLLNEEEIKGCSERIHSILEKDKKDLEQPIFDLLRDKSDNDIFDILEYKFSPHLYKYFSLISDSCSSFLDYCSNYNIVLVDKEAINQSFSLLYGESRDMLRELTDEGKIISHLEMYQDLNKILCFSKSKIIETKTYYEKKGDIVFNLKQVPYTASKREDATRIIQMYIGDNYNVVICCYCDEHLYLVNEILNKTGIKYELRNDLDVSDKYSVALSLYNLPAGFILEEEKVVYLSSNELFNDNVRVSRFDNRFKEATILRNYEELEPGDYVVHEYQGIGQFLELTTLETDGIHRDYLKIAYSGDELLYVPLSQFQLVRKYLGKEGIKPRLSRLHTKDWENTKARIKERIQELANRLFNLYVERNKIKGFEFCKDDEYQKRFELSCPFQLTIDQQSAIRDIKKDMESPHPMDRLLCGDVGFGKTEVAFVAAYKAILSGKQVAILCPTTLLARQHFERAKERFARFNVNIAVFSRLISGKQQKDYINGVANGSVHLAIGTHRLLSDDIHFKDLGLLIIDEEQRFGVEQKEKLKEMKNNIDVLTLSATPIPRTLQISMLGVRSLSTINTPPKDRMPIQTYVTPYNINVCKELIERELGRDGQVFYLHNNIETLSMCAARLQKLLPGVPIGIGHGKMDKSEIENIMDEFYQGKLKVLVCTTIIENGIDIPNANMIIVEDSEKYGLSQLYQIKGRVGRSDRIAYAYLMYNDNKVLKDVTKKRLKAIQGFTELGSGYKIAQRDLLIRGAGDILGPEQAGFIDSLGLDMYIKLLNEAVKEKVDGASIQKEEIKPNLTLSIDAYIPNEYASDSNKIELYQEIMNSASSESLLSLRKKIRDIYGKIPHSVELLFIKRNIDLLIKDTEIKSVKENKNCIEISVGDPYIKIKGIGNILFESLIPYISKIKVSFINNNFKIFLNKSNGVLNDLEGILYGLKNIKENHKTKEIY